MIINVPMNVYSIYMSLFHQPTSKYTSQMTTIASPKEFPRIFKLWRSSLMENDRSIKRYRSIGKLLAGCRVRVKLEDKSGRT